MTRAPALTARFDRAVTYAGSPTPDRSARDTTDHERKPPWRERKEADRRRHEVDVSDRFNACRDCQYWYYSELRRAFAERNSPLAAEFAAVVEQFPEGDGTCDRQCTGSDD